MLEPPSECARAAGPSETLRPAGVLVVDDEEAVRQVLASGLQQHGFAVWPAAGGQEALAVYQRHGADIDVVLLDVRMPGLDGPQTLAALRRLNPQLRCCFMSGQTGPYSEEELKRLGAAHFFEKPFRLGEMVQTLRQHVGGAP